MKNKLQEDVYDFLFDYLYSTKADEILIWKTNPNDDYSIGIISDFIGELTSKLCEKFNVRHHEKMDS